MSIQRMRGFRGPTLRRTPSLPFPNDRLQTLMTASDASYPLQTPSRWRAGRRAHLHICIPHDSSVTISEGAGGAPYRPPGGALRQRRGGEQWT